MALDYFQDDGISWLSSSVNRNSFACFNYGDVYPNTVWEGLHEKQGCPHLHKSRSPRREAGRLQRQGFRSPTGVRRTTQLVTYWYQVGHREHWLNTREPHSRRKCQSTRWISTLIWKSIWLLSDIISLLGMLLIQLKRKPAIGDLAVTFSEVKFVCPAFKTFPATWPTPGLAGASLAPVRSCWPLVPSRQAFSDTPGPGVWVPLAPTLGLL